MPMTLKLTAAAIVIALTAAIVGIVAYERGHAAPRERSISYTLLRESPGDVGGSIVREQRPRYRLRLAPDTVVAVGPGSSCHYLTWRAVRAGSSAP